jgi:hypothetical protein
VTRCAPHSACTSGTEPQSSAPQGTAAQLPERQTPHLRWRPALQGTSVWMLYRAELMLLLVGRRRRVVTPPRSPTLLTLFLPCCWCCYCCQGFLRTAAR